MKLRNKKTSEITTKCVIFGSDNIRVASCSYDAAYNKGDCVTYNSLAEFCDEWEDAPKVHKLVLPENIRKAVSAWVKAQENPIKRIAILCGTGADKQDKDGFYDYIFYGYVGRPSMNLTAIHLEIRTRELFKYEQFRDYELYELGLEDLIDGQRN